MKYWLFVLLLIPTVLLAQDDMWDDEDWGDEDQSSMWSGFLEAGLGTRFSSDPLVANRNTLEELRFRVESEWHPGDVTLGLKADIA